MTKDSFIKLRAGIDRCIYHRLTVLRRIKDLFYLKNTCSTLTYNIWFNGKSYSTYQDLRDDLKNVDLRCSYTLSQPFTDKWNTFNYYVGIYYLYDYGNRIKDSYIRTLFTLRKKAYFEAGKQENKVSLRRLCEEAGVPLN